MSQILAIGSGGGGGGSVTVIPYTLVTTTPYVVLDTDYFISVSNNDTLTGMTILLPDTTTVGRVFIIKDNNGGCQSINGVAEPSTEYTISTVSGITTIDTLINYILSNEFQSASFVFNGTSYEVF